MRVASPDQPTVEHAPTRIRWPVLCAGALITLTLGLSAHVLMMTVLHVPSPPAQPRSELVLFANQCATSLAILLIYQLTGLQQARIAAGARMLILFLLTAMMAERLLRYPLMNGFVTTAWTYYLIVNTPKLLPWAATCVLVVAGAPFAKSWPPRLILSILIAAAAFQAVARLADALFAPVLAAAAPLQHPPVYGFPYGWQVTTAAYITYLEPVVACLLATALMWPRLPRPLAARIVGVALLVAAVRSALLRPFAYAGFVADHWWAIFVSDAQFTFEAIVLGLLTALTWSLGHAPGR